jgi:hypothetical protein
MALSLTHSALLLIRRKPLARTPNQMIRINFEWICRFEKMKGRRVESAIGIFAKRRGRIGLVSTRAR